MALGGVDMFSRLGGLHSCKVKSDKPFYCSRERRCMILTRKETHCRSRLAGSFFGLVGFGRSDLAGGLDAMSFSCQGLRLLSRECGEEDGIVDTRINHCREYSLHGSLSFPLIFVPGVLCCVLCFLSRLLPRTLRQIVCICVRPCYCCCFILQAPY